ncbi:MAG: dethiobiotin synthase [Gammaproteobacteria bacterium]|jgi:dethiobiotin synthetase|nr:dethiobiotin synthase [Gammaproteobacteria bacterium]MBT3724466.1 dethiobiotin synthase [Gammaproteobacteria bacterium]MBT4075805.1 dethiobiotin synthase [Gammaproteobacteria bacterium]MBT4194225.1 dethiobiotin synthase [Gammaproteobacteria bacterium]MBT4451167.1 dethiobiotin synthase [Gammaproteobacteria bacterium]
MAETDNRLKGFFITGSDTAVGKTWISCQIIKQLKIKSTSLKVRKPVESGCNISSDNLLIPADGEALFKANDNKESLQQVTPLRFKASTSPDRAARIENQSITLDQLQHAVSSNIQPEDTLLVEGAGGFYSPIAEDALNADLAKLLGLEVFIVIEDRLGAINQSLLTIKAVESEGLTIKAVILNRTNESQADDLDNITALRKRIELPVYSCSYNGELERLNL